MEILIGLFVLVLIGVMLLGVAGIFGFGLFAHSQGQRKKAEANRASILAGTFGTDSATITYDSRRADSLRPTVVIEGAMRCGYELAHDDGGQLLFKRTQSLPPNSR